MSNEKLKQFVDKLSEDGLSALKDLLKRHKEYKYCNMFLGNSDVVEIKYKKDCEDKTITIAHDPGELLVGNYNMYLRKLGFDKKYRDSATEGAENELCAQAELLKCSPNFVIADRLCADLERAEEKNKVRLAKGQEITDDLAALLGDLPT